MDLVAFGGLVGSVSAIGSKVHEFKPGPGRWVFKVDKISRKTSFGGEVKPSAPCRKILRHVKEPCRRENKYFVGKIHFRFSQVSHASLLDVSWLLPEISGG
jgi:hypothetical protein